MHAVLGATLASRCLSLVRRAHAALAAARCLRAQVQTADAAAPAEASAAPANGEKESEIYIGFAKGDYAPRCEG